MRLLLVHTEAQVKYGAYAFQHGLAALAAYVRRGGGHAVRLCHIGPRFDARPFRDALRRFAPDVVGFYVTEDQLRFVRRLLPDAAAAGAFCVAGGPYPSLNPSMIEEERGLDAVCIGEGERPLAGLLDRLARGDDPGDLPGLWVRRGGEVVRNAPGPYLEDLDALPLPDRDLFEDAEHLTRVGITQISHRNSFRVSRGCPFRCAFCSNHRLGTNQQGRYTRLRSVGSVMTEIDAVVRRFRPAEIYFEDDSFTLDRRFVDGFADAYPGTCGLPFEFFAHIGPRTVQILERLRAAGGRRVSFGIESGCEPLRRDVLRKDFSNDEAARVLAEARAMGYQIEAFVMAGLPGETAEAFDETVAFLQRTQPDLYSLSIYFPFRGTDLYDRAVSEGYLDGPVELHDGFVSRREPLLDLPGFPRDRIVEQVRRLPWRVYGRTAPAKAAMLGLYETRLGDPLMRLAAPLKRQVRALALASRPWAHSG